MVTVGFDGASAIAAVAAALGIMPATYLPLVYRNVAGTLTARRLMTSAVAFIGTWSVLILAAVTVYGPSSASAAASRPLSQTEAQALRSSGVILTADPKIIEHGRRLVQEINCQACHTILGQGGAVGPDLTNVASRRTPEWMMRHFRDPQEVSPGTLMPKFNLADKEYLALTEYLNSLPR